MTHAERRAAREADTQCTVFRYDNFFFFGDMSHERIVLYDMHET